MKRLAALLLLLSSPAYAKTMAIVGVALDQSSASSGPLPQKLSTPAGETGSIGISVTHPGGAAYDLTGAQLLLTINGKISRQATITNPASLGIATFPLVIADTQAMLGTYTYDVWLTASDGSRYQVVPASAFVVTAGIGQPGQAVTVPATQTPLAQGPAGPQGPSGTAGIIQSPPGTSLPNRTNTTFDGTLLKATDNAGTSSTDITAPGLVAKTTTVSTSSPLGGGGALSGNLPLTCATCVTTARLISTGTGLSGGGDLSADRTLSLANTAVTPGSYTSSNITVDAQGRITAAANGTGGGGGSANTTIRAITPPPSTTYTSAAGGEVFAIPMWIPSDVTSVKVHIRNQEMGAGGIANISPVNWSICTSNGAQLCSGAQTTTTGITVPGAYDYISSPTTVTRGADGRVIVIASIPSSTTVKASTQAYFKGINNTGTTTVSGLSGTPASIATTPYFIQLEYSTAAKRVVVIGDSIAHGYNSYWDVPGTGQSPYMGLGSDHGYAVFDYGLDGFRLDGYFNDQLTNYNSIQWQWQDFAAVIPGSIVVVETGVNDLANPSTNLINTNVATSYEMLVFKAVTFLRAHGASKIVFETLSPCSSYEAGMGAVRVAYDNWIAQKPYGIDAVIDRDTVLATAPRTAGTTLATAYNSGDGCHPNAVGEAALEAAAFSVLSGL